ncbi:hypothetical protein PoB_002547300 [Plakobranchus ocellatus]|uniref:Uncharacterized protein n=1 Tax=Plakobranchus ocellatus TaxID=259542 RepID=A0AAV3ZX02_9GAST|nr:hypothetical protein PoB_002547300 [Plakobranchus ocellatus]
MLAVLISRSKDYRVPGPHDDLLTRVKRRNLKWYGHIDRSRGLARNSARGEKKKEKKNKMGGQHQGLDTSDHPRPREGSKAQ